MKLWGKTMAELDEDHRRMLAEREERGASPGQLAKRYADAVHESMAQPHPAPHGAYYFGTDIPLPRNTDSTGQYVIPRNSFIPASKWPAIIALAVLAWALAVVAIGIYWALT